MIDVAYLFLFAHVLLACGLVKTELSSPHRWAFLLLIAVCCSNALQSHLIRSIPGDAGLYYTMGFVLHSANYLCITKLTPPPEEPSRWWWALGQICDARWKLRSKPSFEQLPSRSELIIWRLFDIVWLGATIHVVNHFPIRFYASDILDVPDEFLTRLSSISAREMVIRVYFYLSALIVGYASLRMAHAVCSVVALSLGGDPSSWPPLFGSVKDGYTLRHYYS